MQGFMYTVVAFSILSWVAVFKTLTATAPDNTKTIVLVLIMILVALSLTFSIPLYFFALKNPAEIVNRRKLYRKSFKASFSYSLLILGYLALRSFKIDSLLNTLLYLILCVMIVLQVWNKK